MEAFVEQQLEIFEESDHDNMNRRPLLELAHPDISIIDGNYFFISGAENVHILNNGDSFAHKLTMEEIGELPVEIVYTGVQRPDYEVDEKNMFELIVKIIRKMNLMQSNSEMYSFPLGKVHACINCILHLF